MSSTPKQPPRKNVALPPDVVERVDAFRKSQNISSESDALRRLIESGLNLFDKPRDLFLRCALAHKNGSQIGEIIGNILNDHPLVAEVSIKSDYLKVALTNQEEITLHKSSGEWSYGGNDYGDSIEYFPPRPPEIEPRGGYGGKRAVAPSGKDDLDDEIPF